MQELDEHFFHVRLRVASHVQGNLVEINALPHLLGQRGFERGRVGRERWRTAPEGVNDENAFNLLFLGTDIRYGNEAQDQTQPVNNAMHPGSCQSARAMLSFHYVTLLLIHAADFETFCSLAGAISTVK